jgi:hypothetical protein
MILEYIADQPWMPLREGLRFVSGADRLTMGDVRKEVGGLFRALADITISESAAAGGRNNAQVARFSLYMHHLPL